jgi:MoaA/NifB/PqqE/SkfB family radical SAM enzyme
MKKNPLLAFETNLRFYLSGKLGDFSPKPYWIFISLSHKCNYNCQMCGVKNVLQGYELEGSVVRSVCDEVAAWGTDSTVLLTGGEPFLRKDIFDLIGHAVSRGLTLEVVSNGSLIHTPEMAEKIVASGLSNIAVSLDGASAPTHDGIRGVPGGFQKSLHALKLLSSAKAKAGQGPQISVWTTIMKENLSELYDMIALTRSLGVECLVYHPVIVFQEDMQNTVADGPFWVARQNLEVLKDQIDRIVAYQKKSGLVAFLHDPYLWLDYFQGSLTRQAWTCHPFVFVDIGPDGDVRSCGPAFGNVKELGLTGCLATPQAKQARERMSRCAKPCLQTCWAWPQADSMEAAVRKFLKDVDLLKEDNATKKRLIEEGLVLLDEFEKTLFCGDHEDGR